MMGTSHHRHNVDREVGPTQVEGLQREYRVELERRFRKLRGVIRETVDTNDALRLREDRTNADTVRSHGVDDIWPRDQFPFRQRTAKKIAFQNQLREWLDQGILEVVGEDSIEAGEHFSGTYVRSSYGEGVRWANQQLRGQGISVGEFGEAALEPTFNQPIHTDQLEQLYTRNYRALEDITSDLDQTLSRELSRGLIDGENPRTIANRLTKETRTIQRTRARTLARTELLHSHNQAALNRYQEYGVSRVRILGSDPCEICAPYVGNDYPMDNLPRGGPPFHPNCVGSVSPLV